MDRLTQKEATLDRIVQSEGADFQYDRQAILDEYRKLGEHQAGWVVKSLSVIGGLMATLFFLGFLWLVELYDSEISMVVFGLGLIIIAIGINRAHDKLIIDTVSIALYVLGLSLLAIGLTELKFDENVVAVITCAIATGSLFLSQNYTLSLVSVLAISASLLALIGTNNAYNLIHLYILVYTGGVAYLFLNEAQVIAFNRKLAKLYGPLRIGLLISLLFGLSMVGVRHIVPVTQDYVWLSSVPIILLAIYLTLVIIKVIGEVSMQAKVLAGVASGLVLAPTIFAPAISGAIVIMLLSFLVNYKVGLIIGIGALLYFVSQYYYDLEFTLLTKSIILFSSGGLFLLIFFMVNKKLGADEEV